VNPIDFLGVQALRLFAPEMYNFIAANKDQLVGAEDHTSGVRDQRKERRKLFDSLLETVPHEKRQVVKDLMARLFPRWSTAYGGASYGSSWLPMWRKKLRICSPDIFDRYFMLSLPPGDISSAEMQAILDLAGNPQAFESELVRLAGERRPDETTRLRVFLERMEDFTEKDIPEEQIEPILRAVYNVGDQLLVEEDRAGMYDWGNDMRLLRISYQLLKRLATPQQRFEILHKVFTEAKSISLVAHAVALMGQEYGKYTDHEPSKPEEDRTVSANHLSELEVLALRKIQNAASENRLHMAPDFGFLLYRWLDWGSEEEVKAYVSRLTGDDAGLCDYLAGFLQVTHSHGLTDRVSRRTWRVHFPSVQKFMECDALDLLPRCQKILKDAPDWLHDRRRLALETFIREITEPRDEWGRSNQRST